MAVKLRLTRTGRHERPFYRIVAADSRYTRDGRFIEQIGYYDPLKGIESAVINEEAAIKWINNGAQYSDTLKAILTKKGLLAKAKALKAANKPAKTEEKKPAAKKTTTKTTAAKKTTTTKKTTTAKKTTTTKKVTEEESKGE